MDLPAGMHFDSVEIYSDDPTLESVSAGGRTVVAKISAPRWRATLQTPLIRASEARAYQGFINARRGAYEAFDIQIPQQSTPQGTALGSPTYGSHSGDALTLNGFTANQTGALQVGDYLRFANHNKVYQAASQADANGSGVAVFDIYPPLMETPSGGEAVTVVDVPFLMRVATLSSWSIEPPDLMRVTLELVEDIA